MKFWAFIAILTDFQTIDSRKSVLHVPLAPNNKKSENRFVFDFWEGDFKYWEVCQGYVIFAKNEGEQFSTSHIFKQEAKESFASPD